VREPSGGRVRDGSERIGEVIGGRYRLDILLNRGGQGAVYGARDLRAGDTVAVKVLSGDYALVPEWRERMFREAQAMVRLGGTAAVRVLDLEHYLADIGGTLDLKDVISLLAPIATTLEAAHGLGILHRDLKPANIFVTNEGRARLLDFGFVRFVQQGGLTREGFVAGSPRYIAPEAWLGNPNALDHRIDVYGFGAVIFRALAGAPPFPIEDVAELYRAVTSDPRPSLHRLRPDLPREVDVWAEKALAIEREQRYQEVSTLWKALTAFDKP
jgi:serine/threonine protein kinase